MPKGSQGQKWKADEIATAISVDDVKDLGDGNFRVRLSVGNSDNEIAHTDIISAVTCDAAIQQAKQDFSRWLKKAFDLASKRVA